MWSSGGKEVEMKKRSLIIVALVIVMIATVCWSQSKNQSNLNAETKANPSHANTNVSLSINGKTVTYRGMPANWTPSQYGQANSLWADPVFLSGHPNFDRTETLLGETAYVIRTSDELETVEMWFVPFYQVGVLPLKIKIVDSDNKVVLDAEAISVQ
jgi:hypothetical protein